MKLHSEQEDNRPSKHQKSHQAIKRKRQYFQLLWINISAVPTRRYCSRLVTWCYFMQMELKAEETSRLLLWRRVRIEAVGPFKAVLVLCLCRSFPGGVLSTASRPHLCHYSEASACSSADGAAPPSVCQSCSWRAASLGAAQSVSAQWEHWCCFKAAVILRC